MRSKILHQIARTVAKYPRAILAAALILTVASAWYSAKNLQLHTDQDDLVSEKLDYHKRYKDYVREFGDLEYLYTVVEVGDNLQDAKNFARALSTRLVKIPDIKEAVYQVSNPALEKSFLLYLSVTEIKNLKVFLADGPASIEKISGWRSISDIISTMNGIMESPEPAEEGMRAGFGFLSELIGGMEKTLETGKVYEAKLAGAFLGSADFVDEEGFFVTPNGKLLFIMIMPKKSYTTLSVIEEPLAKIREAIAETKSEFPNVKAGLTGKPALQADEMSTTNRDMNRATVLALIAVTLLFVAYFRRLTRPVMAVVSLIFAIVWTLGLTTLVVGYLNLLSSVFAVVLVGAGIEFGLQIVSRYREELHDHKDPRLAVMMCITKTGRGNLTSAMTTAAAFFTTMFTGFKALSELGFIAGTGILLCMVSLVVVLPAMMYLNDRGKRKEDLKTRTLVDLRGIDRLYKAPVLIIIILGVLTVAGAPGLLKLKFDHNLLNLQAEGLESVDYEKMIIEKSDESTWYAISITKTPAESVKIANEMRKKATVGKIEDIETIVPSDQEEKRNAIKELRNAFQNISYADPDGVVDRTKLLASIKDLEKNLFRISEMAFKAGYVSAVEELDALAESAQKIYDALKKADVSQLSTLAKFQNDFILKLRGGLMLLEGGLSPASIRLADLPESIQRKFVSKNGNYATYVYPKYDIWDPLKMNEFIKDIRDVDPFITGTPVEVFESSKLMQKSFQKAALYSLLVIILLVFVDFKKPLYSSVTLLPLFAGVLWLLELMGWLGIPFNLANFFAIPILLGVGVDNGVQIVHRYLDEGHSVKVMAKSTGIAVVLTSLTTGISFGTLIISSHRGIQSLGIIMTLGTLTCFIGSVFLLPAILNLKFLKRT